MSKKITSEGTKTNDNESEDHQWSVSYLKDQFENESDRAAVILASALLDDALTTLLRTHLVPCSSSSDSLFDNTNSPLSNFSSKIDMANRLGLISTQLTRDIHLVRKIRNSFAHDVFGCDFEDGSVKNRVRELMKSMTLANYATKRDNSEHLKGTRGNFLSCTFFILWFLNDSIRDVNQLREPNSETFLYDVDSH